MIRYIKKIIALSLFMVAVSAHAQHDAVINVSAAYLRQAPDYESPLETQELMGVPVRMLEKDRYWVKVQTDQPYTAWVNELALVQMDEEAMKAYENAEKYMVTAPYSNVLSSPGAKGAQLSDLVCGDILRADASRRRKSGFVPVMLPDSRKGWVRVSDVEPYRAWEKRCAGLNGAERCAEVIANAMKMTGVPYLWGGMSTKGFDCSGLTRISYLMAGVKLPRNASQQYAAGVDIPVLDASGAVSLDSLKPGDLLFFGPVGDDGKRRITHVGIYLGDGRMVHSSQVVRVNSVIAGRSDVYENADRLFKACRIVK